MPRSRTFCSATRPSPGSGCPHGCASQSEERLHATAQEVLGLLEKGIIKPHSGQVYPLQEIKAALKHANQNARDGKVLLSGLIRGTQAGHTSLPCIAQELWNLRAEGITPIAARSVCLYDPQPMGPLLDGKVALKHASRHAHGWKGAPTGLPPNNTTIVAGVLPGTVKTTQSLPSSVTLCECHGVLMRK